MPITQITDVSGTKYYKYQGGIDQFSSIAAMRAYVPPKSDSTQLLGARCELVTISTGSATYVPFIWSDDEATADNGSTIIKPTSISGDGRWVKLTAA